MSSVVSKLSHPVSSEGRRERISLVPPIDAETSATLRWQPLEAFAVSAICGHLQAAGESSMIGNVSSQQAWEALHHDGDAQLVDVRTTAEWSYVGIPDLDPIGKRATLIVWQEFPSGEINPDFKADLGRANLRPDQSLYFLCRSGARSLAAAREAEAAGFSKVFNVSDGFEGPPDAEQHRGRLTGWKAAGLPWRQS